MNDLLLSRRGTVLLLAAMLSGCGSPDMTDLQAYIAETKNKQKGTIAPLPELKPATPFAFTTENFRDPFGSEEHEKQQDSSGDGGLHPDLNRPKEELESYALDSLHMVGMVVQGKVLWGLIKAPDGTIHRIKSGNYLGKNFGKVVSVATDQIDLIEIIPEGSNAWRERSSSIALVEK